MVDRLADTIGALLGRPVHKEYLPERAGEVRDSWADVGTARRLLGYEARVGLEDGLRVAVQPFLERTVGGAV
jgi:nucleoside-diphosphate-sugar epimerase